MIRVKYSVSSPSCQLTTSISSAQSVLNTLLVTGMNQGHGFHQRLDRGTIQSLVQEISKVAYTLVVVQSADLAIVHPANVNPIGCRADIAFIHPRINHGASKAVDTPNYSLLVTVVDYKGDKTPVSSPH